MFLLILTLRATIYCGAVNDEINAYILGKDVFQAVKWEEYSSWKRLINRVIPRSWGEDSVNISLDLSMNISHFSPRFLSDL